MEEQEQAGVNQPNPNGNPQADAGTDADAGGRQEGGSQSANARRAQLDEVTQAYERARDELSEAVRALRSEIAKIDLEQARTRAKGWVDENPLLAVFIGVGAGIITGRLLSQALRPDPPSLTERARHSAGALGGKAGGYADELGAALAYQLSRAARSAGEAGERVSHRGAEVADVVSKRARDVTKDLSERARETGKEISRKAEHAGRDVSRRAGHASEDAARRAEELADAFSESTLKSAHVLEDAADELAKTLKKRSKSVRKKAKKNAHRRTEFPDALLNVTRTAVAAVVVKKVNDWMKAMR